MKKIFTVLLVMTMLAGLAVFNVSAAPTVYMYDDFEDVDATGSKWIWDVSKFTIMDGILESGIDGVVHQSAYAEHGPYQWRNMAAQVDLRFLQCREQDANFAGFWFKGASEFIMEIRIYPLQNKIMVDVVDDGTGLGEVASADINIEVGEDADFSTLGMKVDTDGILRVYFNYQEVLTYAIPDYDAENYESPVLLLNRCFYTQWDNVIVASPDYDLTKTFDENGATIPGDDTSADDTSADDTSADDTSADDTSADDTQNPDDTQTPDDTQNPDDTQSPDDSTDPADSQDPADSEEPADTQQGDDTTNSSTGRPTNPQTGDTTVLFAIAAVAALGLAIAVKKIVAK